MYTYVQTAARPSGTVHRLGQGHTMGPLSRVSPARHSESYILLKEEGAGEKKKEGAWSVLTGCFLIPPPTPRLKPASSQGGASPADPAQGWWGAGGGLLLLGGTSISVCARVRGV